MTLIAYAILAALVAASLVEAWLTRRQAACVAANRQQVPAAFAQDFTLAEHQKAADYTVARCRLAQWHRAWDTGIAVAWFLVAYEPLYAALSALLDPGIARSVAFMLLVSLADAVLDLPFAVAATFGTEARFGFNRTSPKLFAADAAKGMAVNAVIGGLLCSGLFWLLGWLPEGWWLYAWAGFMAFSLAMVVAYPRFIAPLFNEFRPLEEGELRTRVERLLARCGFEADGVFVMDGSKRSSHGNAYFTGFGRAKRIVFYDTLIEKCQPDEIEAVLAHELGHFKHGHIRQRVAQAAVAAFLAFAFMGWAFEDGALAAQFGLPADPAMSLLVAAAAFGPMSLLLAPLSNWLHRRAEFQADAFADRMVGAEPLARALVRLNRENAGTLTPDAVYAAFHYSHPPLGERVARLMADRRGPPEAAVAEPAAA